MKLSIPRVDPETDKPVSGKPGKYERGYSVNVQRLSSVAETKGGNEKYEVVAFEVSALRVRGFTIEPDAVIDGHAAYAGPASENRAHALVIGSPTHPLYRQQGKELLASCCYHVDQDTGAVGERVVLGLV